MSLDGAEATYRMDVATFVAVVSGRESPQEAFFARRIEIAGNIEKGLKLAVLFGRSSTSRPTAGPRRSAPCRRSLTPAVAEVVWFRSGPYRSKGDWTTPKRAMPAGSGGDRRAAPAARRDDARTTSSAGWPRGWPAVASRPCDSTTAASATATGPAADVAAHLAEFWATSHVADEPGYAGRPCRRRDFLRRVGDRHRPATA